MTLDIYEYQTINISLEPSPDPHGIRKATIATASNRWAKEGWRTVAVMPSQGSGYADAILLERKIGKKSPHEGLLAVRYTAHDDRVYVFPPDQIEFVYDTDGI